MMNLEFKAFCDKQSSCEGCEFNRCTTSDQCQLEYINKYSGFYNLNKKIDIIADKLDIIISLLSKGDNNE